MRPSGILGYAAALALLAGCGADADGASHVGGAAGNGMAMGGSDGGSAAGGLGAAGTGAAAAGSPAGGSAGASGGSPAGGASLGGGGASAGETAAGGASGAGTAGAAGQATKPEGVPADYQLQIDETFAEPASLMKLKFADPKDWVHSTQEGGYVEATAATYAPPHASLHSLAIFGDKKFGAFVLDAEVMQTNPSGGHRDFCLAWGLESPSRYYYSHIAEAHDAVAHNIHIVLDADRTAITKTNTPGFQWGMNVWHKLRLTRSATGDMAVYGDDFKTPILTASDSRLGAGYVGFGSFDDKGRVRNVKVWAPSVEAAPAGFFTAK